MISTSENVKVEKYEIEKFNGKNLFISQKLHKALAKKEKKPEDMKDEDWEELDLEVRAATILCLERDVAFLVNEEATAADDIDVKIDDEDQALILLLSLPKSYENLVQTLMLVGDTLTMDETRTSLLVDDIRKFATSVMSSSNGRERKKGVGVERWLGVVEVAFGAAAGGGVGGEKRGGVASGRGVVVGTVGGGGWWRGGAVAEEGGKGRKKKEEKNGGGGGAAVGSGWLTGDGGGRRWWLGGCCDRRRREGGEGFRGAARM
ncbi:heterogeneous nuclear ribonucleoprotein A1, A2/B1 homolog [Arachis ipaensis]|uniref:heterogeneous nuclear ribonucleoprotein A1, A2/B1 homolog n=1 Tax=Arachis ipaensis TaxID=130454 RepID=UPI000A2B0995|nr:heterogeneous nuclear ribonucleoprotein A1, A2/B1 homolog [Arachis ipaensis]